MEIVEGLNVGGELFRSTAAPGMSSWFPKVGKVFQKGEKLRRVKKKRRSRGETFSALSALLGGRREKRVRERMSEEEGWRERVGQFEFFSPN